MDGVTIICAFVILVALIGLAVSVYDDKKQQRSLN